MCKLAQLQRGHNRQCYVAERLLFVFSTRLPTHAFDKFIDLFLWVEMFVNGRAAFEIVVGEGHAGRVKVASVPSRQTFNDFECARIYEWHRSAPGERF
jgi:hypothetical protein